MCRLPMLRVQRLITLQLTLYTRRGKNVKGYASSCVSTLSQLMLDSGFQTTSLYTDMTNPTPNKIYMEIGYEHVADSALVLFHEKVAGCLLLFYYLRFLTKLT